MKLGCEYRKKSLLRGIAGLVCAGLLAGCAGQNIPVAADPVETVGSAEETGQETLATVPKEAGEKETVPEETQQKTPGQTAPEETRQTVLETESFDEMETSDETESEQKQQEVLTQKKELLKDPYGDYQESGGEIVFVLDGLLEDGGFNHAIYDGIQMYALGAGIPFSYYKVENRDEAGYREVIERAVQEQAKVVVCAGSDFGEAIGALQEAYPQIAFLMIDGVPQDSEGEPVGIAENVHCALFQEQESGFFAGYLAVMEGYRSLGFIGGKESPTVIRYGSGYLQGIDAAARELGLSDVTVRCWYAGSFLPDPAVSRKASRWYEEGTEVIFSCGGSLYESVLEAAEQKDGMLIGVDVDQSPVSERFLTSAIKDISNAVVISLDDYYASGGQWSEAFAGQETRYGIEDNCTGLPVLGAEWRFLNVTKEDYVQLYQKVKKGEIVIDDGIDTLPELTVTVNWEA